MQTILYNAVLDYPGLLKQLPGIRAIRGVVQYPRSAHILPALDIRFEVIDQVTVGTFTELRLIRPVDRIDLDN